MMDTSTRAICTSSVPTKGRPGFVPWFQGLTESNQKRWLSIMAAYGQQMWDEQRDEFLFGDSVESTKLEPEQDNSGKRRVGKTSRSKERKKLGTGVEFLGSLPSKIEDFEVKPGMGRRNLQDLVRIGLKELWRASGWPGQPSWRNTALKKDNYWPQGIPQWWETGDPSKMTIDNCYKMLENMMEGAKGTIPEEQRIRYLPYNPEVTSTKDRDTMSRSKSSKMAKAIAHVEVPGKDIEDPIENDGAEHPTGIDDIRRAKGGQESSESMIEGLLTPKDKYPAPSGQESNLAKSTGNQPPSKEVTGGNDAQIGGKSGSPSIGETRAEVTAQNGGQSFLGWAFNDEGRLMGTMLLPEKPEAKVLRGDATESQVGTRPADMDQDTENKREDSTEMRNKKGECSAELSTVKSVNSRKRPAGAEASIEPPAKRPKSENEQVNQGAVRRQPAIKAPSKFQK
ncbi:hypothetical protein CPB86DRAFT_178687 [Serendipita vermifera]|nr:hypothetical protein CPB86DRAFT_178687 [Serendipita vermifera]